MSPGDRYRSNYIRLRQRLRHLEDVIMLKHEIEFEKIDWRDRSDVTDLELNSRIQLALSSKDYIRVMLYCLVALIRGEDEKPVKSH